MPNQLASNQLEIASHEVRTALEHLRSAHSKLRQNKHEMALRLNLAIIELETILDIAGDQP